AGPAITTFTDTRVSPGTSYTYRVRAINGTVASDWSNAVNLATDTVPAAPSGLSGSVTSPTHIALTWTKTSSNLQAFAIWRTGGGADWARVGLAGPAITTFTDTGLLPGTRYSYRVRAVNSTVASDWSNPVSLTLPAP